jgi:hypothetical protein
VEFVFHFQTFFHGRMPIISPENFLRALSSSWISSEIFMDWEHFVSVRKSSTSSSVPQCGCTYYPQQILLLRGRECLVVFATPLNTLAPYDKTFMAALKHKTEKTYGVGSRRIKAK